jgi:hypothetical protein
VLSPSFLSYGGFYYEKSLLIRTSHCKNNEFWPKDKRSEKAYISHDTVFTTIRYLTAGVIYRSGRWVGIVEKTVRALLTALLFSNTSRFHTQNVREDSLPALEA